MTTLALHRTAPWLPRAGRIALAEWLLCWIVLPNAGFWLLWIIGAPPRYPEILATGAAGLVVRHAGRGTKAFVFLAALAYSVLSFVAALFNLAIASLLASVEFLIEMRPGTSIEYLVCAAGIAVTVAIAMRRLGRPTGFTGSAAVILAVAVTVGAAGIDYWMSYGMRGAYKRSAPGDAVFGSGVSNSGFANAADGRHLVLVMVEAMGLPTDPRVRDRLLARWRRHDVAARYTLTHGITPYFGSTTSGEVRELCGRWGDYPDLLGRTDPGCLPARLKARGYDTVAMHSFAGDFFDRTSWYPNVGFADQRFAPDLLRAGAGTCPGVFPGACDRDVPAILARRLLEAKRPQFVYWLTVNTHLPVPTDAALRTARCTAEQRAAIGDFGMICRQFQLWDQLADTLAAEMTKPGFPRTDVLLVGDHMPPYFDRRQRSQFDPANVPWILLRHR